MNPDDGARDEGSEPMPPDAADEDRPVPTDPQGPGEGDARGDDEGPVRSRPAWLRLGVLSTLGAAVVLGGSFLAPGERMQLPGAAPVTAGPTDPASQEVPVAAADLGCAGAAFEGGPAVWLAAALAPGGVTSRLGSAEGSASGDGAEADGSGAGPTGVSGSEDGAAAGGSGEARVRVTGEAEEVGELGETPLVAQVEAGATVVAADSAAPGVVAGQLALAEEPGARWLALTACQQADEDQWLVAGGGRPGRTERLVLTNPGEDAVTADVQVWGSQGPLEVTGGTGIVVPPGGRTVELLDALAPGADVPVVRVTASGGPVVAHLSDEWRDGTTDLGGEIVAPGAGPGTDLVLPALPRGGAEEDGNVVLRLLAPDSDAVVDLTALTVDGGQALPAHVTRLEEGKAVHVVLDDLPRGAVGLRVRSTTPVVAGAASVVAPSSDEPVALPGADEAAVSTAPGEDPGQTDGPDGAVGGQGGEVPVVRAAGDLAWVGAVEVGPSPVGTALPPTDDVPAGAASLAVSVVDATEASVVWLDADGEQDVVELGAVGNDSTVVVDVPEGARAVWVVPTGEAGVTASLRLVGTDARGPYLTAAVLPAVPWQSVPAQVRVATP